MFDREREVCNRRPDMRLELLEVMRPSGVVIDDDDAPECLAEIHKVPFFTVPRFIRGTSLLRAKWIPTLRIYLGSGL